MFQTIYVSKVEILQFARKVDYIKTLVWSRFSPDFSLISYVPYQITNILLTCNSLSETDFYFVSCFRMFLVLDYHYLIWKTCSMA